VIEKFRFSSNTPLPLDGNQNGVAALDGNQNSLGHTIEW
jgi:hypothetical protein